MSRKSALLLIFISSILLFVITGGADASVDIDFGKSIDLPDPQRLSALGQAFTIKSIGYFKAGEDVVASVGVEGVEGFQVIVINSSLNSVWDEVFIGEQVIDIVMPKDAFPTGTYAMAVFSEGILLGVKPLIVYEYELIMSVDSIEVKSGEELGVRVEIRKDGELTDPVGNVEVSIGKGRFTLEGDNGVYTGDILIPPDYNGSYFIYGAVTTGEMIMGSYPESIAFLLGPEIFVERVIDPNATPLPTPTASPSPTPLLTPTPSPTIAPTSTPAPTAAVPSPLEVCITPYDPNPGEFVKIYGRLKQKGEVKISTGIDVKVPVNNGKYHFEILGIAIPSKPNRLAVTISPVSTLSVGVKLIKLFYVNFKGSVSGTTGKFSQSGVPEGIYDVRITGETSSDVSTLDLKVTGSATVTSDPDGYFEFNYNTQGLPSKSYDITVSGGGGKKTFTLPSTEPICPPVSKIETITADETAAPGTEITPDSTSTPPLTVKPSSTAASRSGNLFGVPFEGLTLYIIISLIIIAAISMVIYIRKRK